MIVLISRYTCGFSCDLRFRHGCQSSVRIVGIGGRIAFSICRSQYISGTVIGHLLCQRIACHGKCIRFCIISRIQYLACGISIFIIQIGCNNRILIIRICSKLAACHYISIRIIIVVYIQTIFLLANDLAKGIRVSDFHNLAIRILFRCDQDMVYRFFSFPGVDFHAAIAILCRPVL